MRVAFGNGELLNSAFAGIEKAVELTPGKEHQVQLLLEGSCMVVYLDETYAMSARLYNRKLEEPTLI